MSQPALHLVRQSVPRLVRRRQSACHLVPQPVSQPALHLVRQSVPQLVRRHQSACHPVPQPVSQPALHLARQSVPRLAHRQVHQSKSRPALQPVFHLVLHQSHQVGCFSWFSKLSIVLNLKMCLWFLFREFRAGSICLFVCLFVWFFKL